LERLEQADASELTQSRFRDEQVAALDRALERRAWVSVISDP